MELTTLDTLDQAKALVDCVYAVYGLTFHRDHVYVPERMLELNRRGLVRSFLAVEDGAVLGHLGWLRPFFELTRDGEPLADPGIGEAGLSIVRPEARSKHVQTQLAMTMAQWANAHGMHGVFMKCVTNHVFSQRTAANMGARPLALFLAGVPKWVVYDRPTDARESPISTLLHHASLVDAGERVLRLPRHLGWVEAMVRASGLSRRFAEGGAREEAPTDVEVEFQPGKRLAQVHVLRAGPDLAARLAAVGQWLLAGHMEHVSFFLPAGSAQVQAQGRALEEAGLFPAGWIPGLHRGADDVLVYLAIAHRELDVGSIEVFGDDAKRLRDEVVRGWRKSLRRHRPELATTVAPPGLSVRPRG